MILTLKYLYFLYDSNSINNAFYRKTYLSVHYYIISHSFIIQNKKSSMYSKLNSKF